MAEPIRTEFYGSNEPGSRKPRYMEETYPDGRVIRYFVPLTYEQFIHHIYPWPEEADRG